LEVLQNLAARLGHLKAEHLHARVGGDSPRIPGELRFENGLRTVFPKEEMKGLRQQFLKALQDQFSALHTGGTAPGFPHVVLEFRNDGLLSWDNECPARWRAPRRSLGPDPDTGNNWMEIRGNVINHRSDAEYRFQRTIERCTWYQIGGAAWKYAWMGYKPRGTPDTTHRDAEDAFPDHNHIYVIDNPGIATNPPGGPSPREPGYDDWRRGRVTAVVYAINATEVAEVRIGSSRTFREMARLEWRSLTWMEKVVGKLKWERPKEFNFIQRGDFGRLDLTGRPPDF
jgi:hypothetical protein